MLSFHAAYEDLFSKTWDNDIPDDTLITELEKLSQYKEYKEKETNLDKRGLLFHFITCLRPKPALRLLELGIELDSNSKSHIVAEVEAYKDYKPEEFEKVLDFINKIGTETKHESSSPSAKAASKIVLSEEDVQKEYDILRRHIRSLDKAQRFSYLLQDFLPEDDNGHTLRILKEMSPDSITEEDKRIVMGYREFIRGQSWKTEKFKYYDAVCKELRRLVPPHSKPALTLDKDIHPITLKESYEELFDSSSISVVTSEVEAKRNVLAQINVLLRDPRKCFPYLKHLNEELKRFYAFSHGGAEFPKPDLSNSEFVPVDRLFYLRPHTDYKGIKKDSTLQQLLLSRFKNLYRLDGSAYKLAGLIDENEVNKFLKNGVFAVEDRHGPGGLFHGKLSHMLQAAIILLAIEDGTIKTEFTIPGEKQSVKTIKVSRAEVLSSFADPKVGYSLWEKMRDQDDVAKLSFGNPFTLNSVVMHEGEKLGFPELAHSLTDTYVKTLSAQLKLRKDENPACKDVEIGEFFDTFCDVGDEHIVGAFDVTHSEQNVTAAVQKEKNKGSTEVIAPKQDSVFGHSAVFKINRYRTQDEFKHAPMSEAKAAIKKPGMS